MSSTFLGNFADHSGPRLVGSAFKSLSYLISVERVSPPTVALFLSACEVYHFSSPKGTSRENVIVN